MPHPRLALSACAVFLLILFYVFFFMSPFSYPEGVVLEVKEGATITETAELLREQKLIRSPFAFSLLVRFMNSRAGVLSGIYAFPKRENAFSIAYRMTKADTKIEPVKVTIPEGSSVREIALIVKESLHLFDDARFIALAKTEEGYLFPDTYFFLPAASPETVIKTMKETFLERTKDMVFDRDTLIMASLLEKEARQMETRRTIAGILWKRLQIGMPLQVDAVFGYIFARDTYSPSLDDLKVDSPYNTYKYRGLPPGPINNPGLGSIEAALTPIKTPYLYYLTDKEGNIYYGKTFEEHTANKEKAR